MRKKAVGFEERIDIFSDAQLGIPFKWGPLGEGEDGAFDAHPTISFKRVDCVTFVEQTMALALAQDLPSAVTELQKIRYKDGKILFKSRNHFPSVDWIPNNIKAGYLKDITREVAGDAVKIATKTIDKELWYANMKSKNLEGPGLGDIPEDTKARLVKAMLQVGLGLAPMKAELPYLPMSKLPEKLASIPSGTVITIVRQNKSRIPVLVSHQGFLIRKGKGATPYFRHAGIGDKAADVPFLEYFYKYFNSRWPLQGLNLTTPLDPGPDS